MAKRSKQKQELDRGIKRHKDEIIEFTVMSDDLGELDVKTTAGELFENLRLVFMDPVIRDAMTTGKLYSFAHSVFKGSCEPEPCYMFKAGVEQDSDELFQLDPDKDYEHYQIYAFPLDVFTKWIQPKKSGTIHSSYISWDVPEGFDIEALTDFIETEPTPEELDEYLRSTGATPHKEN